MTTIGVIAETADAEHRVALDPDTVALLAKAGHRVLVEAGAGSGAHFTDAAYLRAGAAVAARAEIARDSKVIALVRPPEQQLSSVLGPGQLLLGLVDPLGELDLMQSLAEAGVTVAAFELLPRTLSRAQSMDALSSQASAAGYRAVLVAAEAFGRYFSMMITASGTARPARVLVIGTGVAGLQALGTAKRLGAVVTGYDVRPASRQEVESLGAQFLTSSVAEGASASGYARALTADEQMDQQKELAAALPTFDVIITTAKVPGRRPPLLVSEQTLALLAPGSVCVDMGASALGGNVAGSVDGERVTTASDVLVIGAGNLAADLPTSSSQMYARNVRALLESLLVGDAVTIDVSDEVHSAVVVCHDGTITSPAVRDALDARLNVLEAQPS